MKLKKLDLAKETLAALSAQDEATLAGGISLRCGDSNIICATDYPICRTHVASNCRPCY